MKKLVYSESEESPWLEDYEWVGIVYSQDVKPNVTLITPLAFYDQNEGWQTITENERSQNFPNNGKVARFTSDFPKQKENRLYWFWPKHNLQNLSSDNITATDSRYSCYLTYSESTLTFEPLAQIFDWSSRASHLFAVPDLLEQGIPVGDCLSHTIFIHYQNQIYGPLRLEPDWNTPQILKPREYHQRSSAGGQLLLLNGYSFARDKVITLETRSFIDQKTLSSPVSQVDWSLPQTTIKRVLRAGNSASAKLQEREHLVEKHINELAALSNASSPESLHIEMCVIQRAQYLIQHQLERLGSLQTLIEELPEEHPLLEKARVLEIKQRKASIEQEAARQCETEQQRLQEILKEVQSARESLATLTGEIEQAQQTQARMRTDFEALERFMQEHLTELRQEPLRLLAELQLATTLPSAFFPSLNSSLSAGARPAIAAPTNPQNVFFTDGAITITNLQDLPWRASAQQYGTSTKPAKTCAATWLAGLIPVANESAVRTVLQAVAQTLAGGRIWTVSVPLTALSPLDLFGRIAADQRMFVPAAGDLADIVLEAQEHPEQLGLVLLEGADRAPFLPVIAPLLQHYRTRRQKIRLGQKASFPQDPLRLFHPRALATDDPYQVLSLFTWPANLLLGVTFDQDFGSFALPETYAAWFAQIEPGEQPNTIWSGEQERWQVQPESWYAWEQEIYDQVIGQHDSAFPEELEPWQQLFHQAMGYFGIKKDRLDIIEQLWPQQ